MGKIKQGILGGFSGKVGPVIGSSWKGKAYMKGIALSFNDANTLEQQVQRQKFSLTVGFVYTLKSFILMTFRSVAEGMTELNAAVSYNIQHAISGAFPNQTVDYSKALVGDGPIDNVYNPQMAFEEGALQFMWTDNSGIGNAEMNDNIYVVAYNPDKHAAVQNLLGPRNSRTGSLATPASWADDTVHVWTVAMRSNTSGRSTYLGSIQLTEG